MLVIDDDPTVHDLMRRFLSKEGLRMVATRRRRREFGSPRNCTPP